MKLNRQRTALHRKITNKCSIQDALLSKYYGILHVLFLTSTISTLFSNNYVILQVSILTSTISTLMSHAALVCYMSHYMSTISLCLIHEARKKIPEYLTII